jgi:hypothetical protein
VYYPGTAEVPESVAPNIRNRSYTVAVEVTLDTGEAQGVLFAVKLPWVYQRRRHLGRNVTTGAAATAGAPLPDPHPRDRLQSAEGRPAAVE